MNDLAVALLAYLARSTVVGLVAMVMVVRLSRRRGPEFGAMAAHAGLIALVFTAGLSLAPWPRGWVVHSPSLRDRAGVPSVFAGLPSSVSVVARTEPAVRDPRIGLSRKIDATNTSSKTDSRSPRVAPRNAPEHRDSAMPQVANGAAAKPVFPGFVRFQPLASWPVWLLAVLSLGWAVGVIRFAWAVLGLRRCVAGSRPIEDKRLLRIAGELIAALEHRGTVAFRESTTAGLPATVGFLRPSILLPCGWRAWSEDECRVVLAHELAHIRSGDFAKRLAGQLCVLVHFFHPIAHWLMARLKLQQELAADLWGIRLAGGRVKYLTTLARIALQHDAGRAGSVRFDCSMLAFDGLFLRRIDMLQRDKAFGDATEPGSRRARWMTFGVLGLAAVLVTALRAPLAPAADNGPAIVSDPTAPSPRNTEVPFDLSRVPADAVGVVAFRPSALARDESIQSLLTLARSSDEIKQWLAKAATAGLSPESVEQIIYVQFKTDLETVLKDDLSILKQGALIVKTKAPIDAKAAASALKEIGGKHRFSLVTADDRTAIVGDEAAVAKIPVQPQGQTAKHAWSEAWSGVERRRSRWRLTQLTYEE